MQLKGHGYAAVESGPNMRSKRWSPQAPLLPDSYSCRAKLTCSPKEVSAQGQTQSENTQD